MTSDENSWSYLNPTSWFYYSPYNPLSWASSEAPQLEKNQTKAQDPLPNADNVITPQGKLVHLGKARPNQLKLNRKPRGRDHSEKRKSLIKPEEDPTQHSAPSLRINPHPPASTRPMGFGVSLNDIKGIKLKRQQ